MPTPNPGRTGFARLLSGSGRHARPRPPRPPLLSRLSQLPQRSRLRLSRLSQLWRLRLSQLSHLSRLPQLSRLPRLPQRSWLPQLPRLSQLSRPDIPRPVPPHPVPPRWVTELRRDPYAVFHGPHRRTALSSTAAGVLLLGVTLAAVPGSAAAQTVRPTTPGASAFTAAQLADAPVVQVAKPSPYRMPGGAAASRAAVAVAANLTTTGAADAPGAPAPEPAAQPAPPAAPAPPPGPVWSAPAPGAPITNPFGVPDREYAAGYHTGVDFAVDSGTPLLAVGDATVVSAGWNGAYGNEVVLRLSDGRFAQYAHLSELGVRAGDQVTGGQRIGASGSTGNSTGPHLHFEIRTANRYGAVIDPIAYLSAHGAGDF